MNRADMLRRLETGPAVWDVVVIGGGATGLGIAVDAASRGYSTVLLEQADFAKGTSSRSTKLVHGGVRYLAQGDVGLVREALRERGLLLQNAPHLVHNLPFIIPNYAWWEGPYYSLGMKVYDAMAGKLGLGPSVHLSREETLAAIPNLDPAGLRGGVRYYDGQFDDARLAVNLAQTAADLGAVVLNYCAVTDLIKNSAGKVCGAAAKDVETSRMLRLTARTVVNATGVFVDHITQMDDPETAHLVTPSQGMHLVLPKDFLLGNTAIMIPHTDDGRVLFAVPWHDRALIGTTDTPMETATLEPRPLPSEIAFLMTTLGRYLSRDPKPSDVLSMFAGLRPLAAPARPGGTTKEISRGHRILVSPAGLITIVGGKWTTYRKMASDVLDRASQMGNLDARPCRTENLRIHGSVVDAGPPDDPLSLYGSDASAIQALMKEDPSLTHRLHPHIPFVAGQVIWACRQEQARTVEDVLARRTCALLLDARASCEAAPAVAELMRKELGRDKTWAASQVVQYRELAKSYWLE